MTNCDHIADRWLRVNRRESLETRAVRPYHLHKAFT